MQVGDFGRYRIEQDDYESINWSIVESDCGWSDPAAPIIGKQISILDPQWEFMRPIPGESSHVPDPRSE